MANCLCISLHHHACTCTEFYLVKDKRCVGGGGVLFRQKLILVKNDTMKGMSRLEGQNCINVSSIAPFSDGI